MFKFDIMLGHPPHHPGGIHPLLGDMMPPGGYRGDQKEMDGEWRRPGSYCTNMLSCLYLFICYC